MALDATTLRLRYPAFTNVDSHTIDYWIEDAGRYVDESWPIEADREPAQLAYAAHSMSDQQVVGITGSEAAAATAAGITRWRSGSADMAFSEAAVTAAAAGGLDSTRYGREYLTLLQRNKGGALTTSPGAAFGYTGYRSSLFNA